MSADIKVYSVAECPDCKRAYKGATADEARAQAQSCHDQKVNYKYSVGDKFRLSETGALTLEIVALGIEPNRKGKHTPRYRIVRKRGKIPVGNGCWAAEIEIKRYVKVTD